MLLEAAPRFQLDFKGVVLTNVSCDWGGRGLTMDDDNDPRSVLPFAALSLTANLPIPEDAPWVNQVVKVRGLSIDAQSRPDWIPPNATCVRVGAYFRYPEVVRAGMFPDRVTSIYFWCDIVGPPAFAPGWFPPHLRTLSGFQIGVQDIPHLPAILPPSIQELGMTVCAVTLAVPLSFLTQLKVLRLPRNILRLAECTFPESLEELWCGGVEEDAGTRFPETLRRLHVDPKFVFTEQLLTPSTFPSKLEVLRASFGDLPPGVLPASLRKLEIVCTPLVFRVGSLPPFLEKCHFKSRFCAKILVEVGALPPTLTYFFSEFPMVMTTNIDKEIRRRQ